MAKLTLKAHGRLNCLKCGAFIGLSEVAVPVTLYDMAEHFEKAFHTKVCKNCGNDSLTVGFDKLSVTREAE